MGSAASTSSDGDGGKPRAVVLCHSSQEVAVRALVVTAGGAGEGVIITDSSPRDRQQRADLISRAQAAFVAIDPMLQRSPELVETLSYLKDQRKSVISGPLTFFSRPSGAVGAVCLALGQWDPLLFADSERFAFWAEKYQLLTRSEAEKGKADGSDELEHVSADALCATEEAPSSPQIFFVYCKDDTGEADRILDKFAHRNAAPGGVSLSGEVTRCQHNLESDLTALRAASVVTFVISEACTASDDGARDFRQLFEHALAWGKPLLPIKEQRAPLGGWLAVAMAGRLWYQVDATNLELVETPYANIPDCPCKVKDSCLATDFVVCANGLLSAPQRAVERSQCTSREQATMRLAKERAQVLGLPRNVVDSLCQRVEELLVNVCESSTSLAELSDALGVATTRDAVEIEAVDPLDQPTPEDLLPAEETEASKSLEPLSGTHYEVTRLGFASPPAVLDDDGLPIVGLQLDAMFSYQWGSQRAVLGIHQQGQVHGLRAWFDVYGHMKGNVNSAMAAAVESVACMVVFLTKAYLGSVNCHLEFAYAARCRKPMVFAFLEDPETLELPGWVLEVAGTPQFNVYPSLTLRESPTEPSRVLALDMRAERIRGVPTTDVLFGAVRRLAAWRSNSPLSTVYDGSLLLYATTSALHHALACRTTSDEDGKPTLCTRCGAAFSLGIPASRDGCRRHTAYYVGGSLIAGRWACCQETDCDGPGCQPALHMTDERTWTKDPSYGTHTYEPNP
ncbi:hypothetical protein PHYPSEUDO_005382 [Phytophthora pseudosyringae]|uniref:TIR domain-containing protein n=1 Tax=Phytophthora pseudosyringae TaxID=221518 RepID=A0A8T1VLL1_9STRA|nr:hypothetical protein PHYPSEUDO_005382 [Phytophthora pseudosyringae]